MVAASWVIDGSRSSTTTPVWWRAPRTRDGGPVCSAWPPATSPRAGSLAVTLPDGSTVRAGDPYTDAASAAVGRRVRLIDRRPAGAKMQRLTPPDEVGAGEMTLGALASGTPGHTFVDFAALHVVTTATLDRMSSEYPRRQVAAARFRPNIVVRMFDDVPFVENQWPGLTMSLGSQVRLTMIAPTPRCVVPTLAQGGLDADPDVLRTASKLNRTQVLDLGVLTCVGAYGSVANPGRLRVGDVITVTPAV